MNFFPDRETVERIRAAYPIGSRVCLDQMGDDPYPIEPGSTGTVLIIDDAGTVHCIFDSGRALGLIPGVDLFHKIAAKDRGNER